MTWKRWLEVDVDFTRFWVAPVQWALDVVPDLGVSETGITCVIGYDVNAQHLDDDQLFEDVHYIGRAETEEEGQQMALAWMSERLQEALKMVHEAREVAQ